MTIRMAINKTLFRKILKPTLLALSCAFFLAFTHQITKKTIESNQRQYEERLLREMVNGAELEKSSSGYSVFREGTQIGTIEQLTTSHGYNGKIDLLIALTLTSLTGDREVISVRVTHHEETPGIGDKIEPEVSTWIHQFVGKSAHHTNWTLSPEGDIDIISGATITSRAVTNAIAETLAE
ncbi:MAG: RnfABCDGE type electron transport complex subunit G [Gammaproteobacteria bacterium]|jgi:electron transport complex protein RnfG|nr:RnfABCDGE type electron transport complex subunit G [Gammaproteobacteria bacterium]